MLDLSIIIVNYNVRYFLAQCLDSILKSELEELTIEIIVVDNDSTDGSFPFLNDKFGDKVHFIYNDVNHGFGKACNIGLREARGNTILFLNPDTLLEVNTLYVSYKRLNNEKDLGALGVKLIDGQGRFLPESKRAFPTPWNSFQKLSGLSKLFPKGLGKPYNLNHLSSDNSHYVDVLCGAFMMIKKSILDEIGGFDESFFMYGEDIDLSKRIALSGYKLLYYSESSVVHYKGESHKDKNMTYYRSFYSAMSIYSSKYYGFVTAFILKIAITGAGILAWSIDLSKKIVGPVIDFVLSLGILLITKHLWATYFFGSSDYYPKKIISLLIIYAFVIVFSLAISKYYGKYSTLRNLFSGVSLGVVLIFIIHALLPLDYRFSRMILIVFSIFIVPAILCGRFIYNGFVNNIWKVYGELQKDVILVGFNQGYSEIRALLISGQPKINIIGRLYIEDSDHSYNNDFLGHIFQLKDILKIYQPDEIIFNMDEVDSKILFSNLKLYGQDVKFKGYGKNVLGIIGSSDPSSAGELYTTHIAFNIDSLSSRILKMIFDKLSSLLIILFFPVSLFIKSGLIKEAYKVLKGVKSWVGYNIKDAQIEELPVIKQGVIQLGYNSASLEDIHMTNLLYARNYSLTLDVELLFGYIFNSSS